MSERQYYSLKSKELDRIINDSSEIIIVVIPIITVATVAIVAIVTIVTIVK